VNGIGNGHIPDPDAFSHEGNPDKVVVYELGYPVKLLDRVLAGQLAFETSGDFLVSTYHFP
jgi:hypothetical protein